MMKFKNSSFDTARLTCRRVNPSDIDELGHVNNAIYVNWIQDAATEHWKAIAKKPLQKQYLWFCSRHEIDYRSQLFPNQKVEIRTWLGEPKGARFDRFVDIREKGGVKPAVFAKTTWVLVSIYSGKPIRIQPEIIEAFY